MFAGRRKVLKLDRLDDSYGKTLKMDFNKLFLEFSIRRPYFFTSIDMSLYGKNQVYLYIDGENRDV